MIFPSTTSTTISDSTSDGECGILPQHGASLLRTHSSIRTQAYRLPHHLLLMTCCWIMHDVFFGICSWSQGAGLDVAESHFYQAKCLNRMWSSRTFYLCSKIESELSNKTPGGYLAGLRGLSCCLRGLQWPTFGHCSVRGLIAMLGCLFLLWLLQQEHVSGAYGDIQ